MSNWQQLRQQALERDRYACRECGQSPSILDIHHIIPRRQGGLDRLDNLISYCRPCHRYVEDGHNLISLNPLLYIGKINSLGKDKFHVIVPKQYNDKVKNLRGKQVKIILDDEL
jgi:HNH endonuclease